MKWLKRSALALGVLIFIGLKMLAEAVHLYTPVWVSLMVIVVCLFGSILYSLQNSEKEKD